MHVQPLIHAQLAIPDLPVKLLTRRRLLARLNEGQSRKVTLVCAPAGYGKTTLLSEWATGRKSTAWLSLTAQENDPSRFWSRFAAALGEDSLPETDETGGQISKAVSHLARRLPAGFTLILDDFQAITEPVVRQALAGLIASLPETLRLTIISRGEPPLPLALLRSQDQLLDLHAADLSLTPAESTAFLRQVLGLDLPREAQETLLLNAEGWPAGLKLAALSRRPNQAANRFVADYLNEQALAVQPVEVLDFLLETSLLDRLNGPLCDAVTGRSDGQDMLTYLEQAGLYLSPLDEERCWYRYHRLFAAYLRQRLRSERNGACRELNRRAAAWCQVNGVIDDAVQYHLAAQDFQSAADLILNMGGDLFKRDGVASLLNWLQALPSDLRCASPHLSLDYAWSLAIIGRLNEVEPVLQAIEALPVSKDPCIQIYIALLRGGVARFSDLAAARAHLNIALELTPPNDLRIHAEALLYLGHTYLLEGDAAQAEKCLLASLRESRIINIPSLYLSAAGYLGVLRTLQGRLREAASIYQQASTFIQSQPEPVFSGIDQVRLADLDREHNRLPEARARLEEGLQLAEQGGDFVFVREAYLALARLETSCGRWEAASQALQKAEQVCRSNQSAYGVLPVEAMRARLDILQGDLASAGYWAEKAFPPECAAEGFIHEYSRLTLARLRLAQSRPAEAVAILESSLAAAESAGRNGRLIEILILLALAHKALGCSAAAHDALARSLALAEPEGYVRIFVDEGEPLRLLLAELNQLRSLRRKDQAGNCYLDRLLKAFGRNGSRQPLNWPAQPHERLVEPLSEREIEVLRLIASGMSYEAAARELVVALSTIQWHIKNIYQKLNVHNGKEAVHIARHINLLS
jgi:LuxR family maltose regulon positive regulatory protein